jgi:hypothetical protein
LTKKTTSLTSVGESFSLGPALKRTVDSDDDFVHVSQHPLDEDDEADYDEIEEEEESSGSEEEGF